MIFTTCFAVSVVIIFTVWEHKLRFWDRVAHITSGLRYYVPTLQLTVICLLTISISVIFYYLSKTESMTDDISAFRLEKRILITILLIFDSSYVLRLIYDIILAH